LLVCLPLIFPFATYKSRRRFLLAPPHMGSPWERAVKRLCVYVSWQQTRGSSSVRKIPLRKQLTQYIATWQTKEMMVNNITDWLALNTQMHTHTHTHTVTQGGLTARWTTVSRSPPWSCELTGTDSMLTIKSITRYQSLTVLKRDVKLQLTN